MVIPETLSQDRLFAENFVKMPDVHSQLKPWIYPS